MRKFFLWVMSLIYWESCNAMSKKDKGISFYCQKRKHHYGKHKDSCGGKF